MNWLLITLLALAVAGCADRSNVDQENVALTGHILSLTKSNSRKPSAARAEASRTHASEGIYKLSLMECVSAACKAECASGVKKQSRPKWCIYFKEPTDRRAVNATAQRKSTE
jgi:hypothetical protein